MNKAIFKLKIVLGEQVMNNDFSQQLYDIVNMFETENYEQGLTELKSLSKIVKTDEEILIVARLYIDLGLTDDAKEILTKVSRTSIELKRAAAEILRKEGDIDNALGIMHAIIEEQPSHEDYFVMSQLFFEDNIPEVALRYINKAIELTENTAYYYYKGVYTYELGDFEETIAAFNQAIELDENEIIYRLALGEVLFSYGNFEEALDQFEHVLQLNSNQEEALYFKGSLLLHLEHFTDAINNLRKVLELQPNNVNILLTLAEAYEKNNEIENAFIVLNKIIEVDEFNVPALKRLANIYHSNGDSIKAVELIEEALQLEPEDMLLQTMYEKFSINF